MNYCIGIDGGGTKTAAAISDGKSNILKSITFDTTSYREIGVKEACTRIKQAICELAAYVGCNIEDIAFITIGISAYGEEKKADTELYEMLEKILKPVPFKLVNDVVVGFWGALGGEPGINIVSGTGSIAYGEDNFCQSMRCGGWSEKFSDEGSCYWAGIQAMALFTKESDGRAPRSALYDIVRAKYSLQDDFDFIKIMECDVLKSRKSTAAFQTVLRDAALQGDESAKLVYVNAAEELFEMADAICKKLGFGDECKVSLTGGMRHAGSLITEPLGKLLGQSGMQLIEPKMDPVYGAVLLSEKSFKNLSL